MFLRIAIYACVFLTTLLVGARTHSHRARQWTLLLGSYVVYLSWGSWFIAVLASSTVMNFLLGSWICRSPTKFRLSVGIVFNLLVLGGFKYLPETATSFSSPSLQAFAHLALPIGLSFWTFQAISYLFDLYREEELDPTLLEFALYMAFFPVVISGPVCRMPDMLPQFRSEEKTKAQAIGGGFTRMATGLLMMQVARLLGQGILSGDGINSGFERATAWGGTDVWCLAFGYGLQLFLDFAGYSHIAVGAAQALGFTIPENFDRPFTSATPSVFWTRWHMSLSFWIRDYVFLLLAVARREVWWRNLSLVIAMVLFGLWHKATLLFFVWGAYQGVLLVAHRLIQSLQRRFDWDPGQGLWIPLSWAATMLFVNLGWIFFRAPSWPQAQQMLEAVLSPSTYSVHTLSGSLYALVFAIALGYGLLLIVSDSLQRARQQGTGALAMLGENRWLWLPAVYIVALLLVLGITYTRGADAAQFMYRNF